MQWKPVAFAPFFVAVCLALKPASASTLTGYLSSEAGPLNAVELGIAVTNPELVPANNAATASITLTQTAGSAGTPVISGVPVSLGTIAPGTTVLGNVIVDFSSLNPLNALFRMNVTLTADGFTGGFEFDNLPVQNPCTPDNSAACPFPHLPQSTPLPATLPLFATGLGGLGLLGWRRKRKARAVA